VKTFAETLQSTPATMQDRLHARAYFAVPFLQVALAVFWILSGLIALGPSTTLLAGTILAHIGVDPALAQPLVSLGAAVDVLRRHLVPGSRLGPAGRGAATCHQHGLFGRPQRRRARPVVRPVQGAPQDRSVDGRDTRGHGLSRKALGDVPLSRAEISAPCRRGGPARDRRRDRLLPLSGRAARNPAIVAATLRIVVTADYVFTATAAIAQPVTELWLVSVAGYSLDQTWIVASLALYALVAACWLPVVVIQIRMRDIAAAAVAQGATVLPESYRRLSRAWFWLGCPAFFSVLLIFWLMIAKPA
jgi:uncharacterized membrane protein